MFRKLLAKVIGDPNERELERLQPIVEAINGLEPEVQALTDAQLRAKTDEFRRRLANGETLDDLLVEAYAVVREAARRTVEMRPFDVQLVGAIALYQGKVVEMKTGEGKTLVATMPLYLNSLEGKGAHLITPNDYLAKFGVQWMGPVYHLLGVSVGCIQPMAPDPNLGSFLFDPDYRSADDRYENLRPVPRREAYEADITYGTNNEFGFDYLRDNMAMSLDQCVQRELHYGIVDEVDYILIDEARTPLIISGPAEEPDPNYKKMARLVPRLRRDEDYLVDEKAKVVTLTEVGIDRVERWLGIDNLYSDENHRLTPYIDNALRAHVLFHRDDDYVVMDHQVILVDEFTGRLMHGRRYSEGLHQAIEAKEGVTIQRENLTLATVTLQNFFRMYDKLAGMTGTAATESEEFREIYGLDVMVLPTNVEYRATYGDLTTHRRSVSEIEEISFAEVLDEDKKFEITTYEHSDGAERRYFQRLDLPDVVYKTERAKFRAVIEEIAHCHQQGRPVLVGTRAIETSEQFSRILKRQGVPHEVLNAKRHEQEARIIAQAGRSGAVTIATNMAGRGVDIKLGGDPKGLARERLRKQGYDLTDLPEGMWEQELSGARADCAEDRKKVLALGGLHVIGTERHEARRIDNQLRGRSARQGDPGSSRFYVSLEDELMRRFGGDRVAGFMDRFGMEEDIPIEHDLVSKSIENAQVRVEGYNFDIRKHILEFDDVINKQREVVYSQRRKILTQDPRPIVQRMVEEELRALVASHTAVEEGEEWDMGALQAAVRAVLPLPHGIRPQDWEGLPPSEIEAQLIDLADELYVAKERELGSEVMRQIERFVLLHTVDNLWIHHLTDLDDLREGIGLRAYGHQNPLVAFQREAHDMYDNLIATIRRDVARTIYHVGVQEQPRRRPMRAMRPHRRVTPRMQDTSVQEARRRLREVGRNDPCPCGSGKKYKHCCMRKDKAIIKGSVPVSGTGVSTWYR
ncbi:MAG: SEC-C metal-binding domain-containing protein [Chloroflexota bacterium]|nr:SEC-C metal-binding domain-containing protein [Chloroflexota bacterium]